MRHLQLTDRNTAHGYHLLFDLAGAQLSFGLSVILDGVFPMREYREKVKRLAGQYDACFLPVYCYCSDRETWKRRMDDRGGNIPLWSPVGWDEVERLEKLYEPWASDSTLFLDTMEPIDVNMLAFERWVQVHISTGRKNKTSQ